MVGAPYPPLNRHRDDAMSFEQFVALFFAHASHKRPPIPRALLAERIVLFFSWTTRSTLSSVVSNLRQISPLSTRSRKNFRAPL